MSSCVLLNFYILTMISYWHQIELMSRVNFNHLYFFISFIWKYLQNISHSLSYLPGTHITFENIIFISLQCNCFTAWLPLLVIVEKSFFVPFDLFSLCYYMLGRGLRRSPGVVSVLRSSHKVWSWSWQAAEWIALSSNWIQDVCWVTSSPRLLSHRDLTRVEGLALHGGVGVVGDGVETGPGPRARHASEDAQS